MKVTLKVKKFNPDKDKAPYFQTYKIEAEPTDRVLDVLNRAKWEQDGSLTYRKSCAHGVCGSDAMRINGKNGLACKMLVKDCGSIITLEPMIGFEVVKDLAVEMKTFFKKFKKVKPYLMTEGPNPPKERKQLPEEREIFDDTTKCILCGACTTSCPSFWTNKEYIGPAAIVAAHRFIFDSRDQGTQERLAIMNEANSVWRCRTVFNCVNACPRDINITKAIGEVKKKLLYDSF